MKKLFTLSFAILTLFAVAGCKKSADVKPVENSLAGEYKISGVVSYTINGVKSSSPISSGTLSVYASATPGNYYFVERYGTTELGYRTTHTGTNFTVEPVPDFTQIDNVKYYGFQNGGGTVAGNTIKFERSAATANATYIAPTGNITYSTKQITKQVSVTATK